MKISDAFSQISSAVKAQLGELANSPEWMSNPANFQKVAGLFQSALVQHGFKQEEGVSDLVRELRAREALLQKKMATIVETIRRHDITAPHASCQWLTRFDTAQQVKEYLQNSEQNGFWERLRGNIFASLGAAAAIGAVEGLLEKAGSMGIFKPTATQVFMFAIACSATGIGYNELLRRPAVIRGIVSAIGLQLAGSSLSAIRIERLYLQSARLGLEVMLAEQKVSPRTLAQPPVG